MAWPSSSARTKNWSTEVLTDSDLEAQLDLLHTYFNDSLNASTGHAHTGGTADGPKITLTTGVQGTLPVANGGTALSSGFRNGAPVGSIFMWGTTSAPTGYVLCDGTAYSRTATYDTLFGVIGTTFGTGDGSTTFNVPDFRGLMPVGVKSSDANFDILKTPTTYVGEKNHTLSIAEMPAHTHTSPLASPNTGGSSGVPQNTPGPTDTTSNASNSTGGGGAHNNMPPYITINFIIRYV